MSRVAARMVRKRGGYSLIEVMVTLGLASMLSLIAFPSLSSLRDQYELRSAADQLALEIGRARMQAVAQNAQISQSSGVGEGCLKAPFQGAGL